MASATVCIQDKNGKHYKTICGADYTAPEIRNMLRHLAQAELHRDKYKFLDLNTALIMVNDKPINAALSNEDEALLAALFA